MTTSSGTARTALVTGAGSGVGAATARRLVADGYRVVLVDLGREPLAAVAAEVGGFAVVGDAADPTVMDRAVAAAQEHFGGLDALVAGAGTSAGSPLLDTDDEAWARVRRINLDTAFVSARSALPALVARGGGAVVFVASLAAVTAPPSNVAYAATKHAMLGVMRSIARDYGGSGIRANAVLPGWVRTPMGDGLMDAIGAPLGLTREESWVLAASDVPLGRAATAADIAGVIAFLTGPDSALVSGQAVEVDGGASVIDVPSMALARAAAPDGR